MTIHVQDGIGVYQHSELVFYTPDTNNMYVNAPISF